MHAVRASHRWTTGAAIAGLVAAELAGGAPEAPAVKVVAKPPPTVNATREKRCFDALRPVLARPDWKLTIERGMHDCFGSLPEETFDIDSSGQVLWKANGMPDRRIELMLGERPLLEGIVDVSCRGEIANHEEMDFLTIYPAGGSRTDADRPIQWSPARETLEMLILRLKMRYADERREKLGTVTLDLHVQDKNTRLGYRARVADDILVVTRGKQVLVRRAVTKQEIVELVDWLGFQAPATGNDARGSLVAGGNKIAVAIEDFRSPVLRYIGNAIYCEAHHDTSWGCR